jgi:hypothetical protein
MIPATHDLSPLVLDHEGEAIRTRGLAPLADPTLLVQKL